jgi:signal transduction histidine kinase
MRYALVMEAKAPRQDFAGEEGRRPFRVPWLALAMVAAVCAVGGAAYWDEERESAAALVVFAQEQSTLARSVAATIRLRLAEEADGDRDPRAVFAGGLGDLERPGALLVLLLPPSGSRLQASDGRTLSSQPIVDAMAKGDLAVRLPPPEAAELGLPRRTAVAGLAWIDGGARGRWGVAVVANAERLRDRERRARLRLVLATVLAGGLVLTFGGSALRRQRKELELERELAIAAIQRRRDERLERADRAATLGTFAMGIAHEISTPLGVIAGRAEQLLPGVQADERAERSVRAILDQTDRIHQVVRAFLGLVRGDAPTALDLAPADVASRALALCEHRFARAGVALVGDLPEGLPQVRGDPSLLEHALVNLLLNACDACERGGKVQLAIEGGSTVAFVISDDGIGITSADALRAVEPFFTTKSSGKGTGLGLAIVTEIAKHHRGSLTLSPRKPHGTVARLEIPASRGQA